MTGPERIAVVGAGAAGLCAAKHLLATGADVTVFELGSHVGGLWVYDNDNGRSPAYRSLHLNTEAQETGYRGFRFPDGTSLYPSHETVRAYLESYAETFDLHRHVRFRTAVTSVEPAGDGAWLLVLGDGGVERFDRVVVATGHQGVPAHPPFADGFSGEYLHAHHYRTPEPFRDKRVLVVGVGNSALDIAADICTVTRSTTLSARSPVLIMPRMLLGMPVSRIIGRLEKPWMPWPVARTIRELLTRVAHGTMEQWGFVTPKARTHPSSHPSIIAHFAWDRITARPGVAAARGADVEFTDGSSDTYDTMIAATGYEVDLPFLAEDVSPVRERRVDLYRRIASPHRPGLYFVGFFNVTGGGNIRMMDVQCGWLAAVVAGDVVLPGEREMLAEIERENRNRARMYPPRPRYGLELDPREYKATIRADLQRASEAGATAGREPAAVRVRGTSTPRP